MREHDTLGVLMVSYENTTINSSVLQEKERLAPIFCNVSEMWYYTKHSMNTSEITVEQLLESGAHFGHRTSSAYPKMKEYIFDERQGIHILDLDKTKAHLLTALQFIRATVEQGGVIIFVGSKKQAAPLVEKYARGVGMPYVNNRWLGGTLTNFKIISTLIRNLKELKDNVESGKHDKYTKKEQLEFTREIERLNELVGGLDTLHTLPQALFVIDARQEKTAVHEARALGIPVIALIDTNSNPEGITYPIPANDDGVRSIDLIVRLATEAVSEGLAHKKETPPNVN